MCREQVELLLFAITAACHVIKLDILSVTDQESIVDCGKLFEHECGLYAPHCI